MLWMLVKQEVLHSTSPCVVKNTNNSTTQN
jgi:hypothetical protein